MSLGASNCARYGFVRRAARIDLALYRSGSPASWTAPVGSKLRAELLRRGRVAGLRRDGGRRLAPGPPRFFPGGVLVVIAQRIGGAMNYGIEVPRRRAPPGTVGEGS